jgi:dynamin 1-like protein
MPAADSIPPTRLPLARLNQVDIHSQTTNLVRKYIASPNMIVLVVLPAVDDFHNAEAIKLAQEVDPDGARTLGVVTKADMAPHEMDIKSKLQMEGKNQVKLQLGFIAVRNRTQKECVEQRGTEAVRQLEQRLFHTHPALKGLDPQRWGTDTLVNFIVDLQGQRLDECLPRLQREVHEGASAARAALAALPPPMNTDGARQRMFYAAVNAVGLRFTNAEKGIGYDASDALHVCAHAHGLYTAYADALQEATPEFMSDSYFQTVVKHLANTRGAALSNFLHFPVFKRLLLDAFEQPMARACDKLVSDLRSFVQHEVLVPLLRDAFEMYPAILHEMSASVSALLDEQEAALRCSLTDVNKSQSHVFTLNHYYTVRCGPGVSALQTLLLALSTISFQRARKMCVSSDAARLLLSPADDHQQGGEVRRLDGQDVSFGRAQCRRPEQREGRAAAREGMVQRGVHSRGVSGAPRTGRQQRG